MIGSNRIVPSPFEFVRFCSVNPSISTIRAVTGLAGPVLNLGQHHVGHSCFEEYSGRMEVTTGRGHSFETNPDRVEDERYPALGLVGLLQDR